MSTIVITGASAGIGYHTAKALFADDHKVINIDVNPCNLVGIDYICADITKMDEFAEKVSGIDHIDILINNAAVNFIDWIENTPEKEWDRVVGTNAKGIFSTTKAFLDRLRKSKGTIMNVVSAAAFVPMTHSIAYNASKGAAHIMTLQMARELGPQGITVFGIAPNRTAETVMSGYITEKVCELRDWSKEEADEYQLSVLPAGEETDPRSIAEFVAFLLASKKRHKYLAGTILPYGK